MIDFSDFHQAAADPLAPARAAKADGRPVIGYFCSYTPEELIYAAGAHPVRLYGTDGEISLADAHLQSYCCSLVRGGLENALAGRLSFLDGTVFPHACDSIQRLSDIWRLNTDFSFFADVVLPVKLNTDSARQYMRSVLEKFKNDLERGLGVTVTDDDLRRSFETHNAIRAQIGRLYALRSQDPGLIRSSDLAAVVRGATVMDRATLPDRLAEAADAVERGELAWDASSHKRMLVLGGICDQPDVYQALERAGGAVVYDDLCTGSRLFETPLDTQAPPLDALTDRLIQRPPCPAKHVSTALRGERAARLAEEHRADGAVFVLLKFCDPHAWDYPFMKEHLDAAGVPGLLLELEESPPSEGQLLTRFETFIHML
jgi:bcr-type benzoyl-CoA reductase subunit C